MYESVVARRSSDAVLLVYQDNVRKVIEIEDANISCLNLFGYSKSEVLCRPLVNFFTKSFEEALVDCVEYSSNGVDLLEVVNKIPVVGVANAAGMVIPVSVKAFKVLQEEGSSDRLYYELLIRDVSVIRELTAFREKATGNATYSRHPVLGILEEESILSELSVVTGFCQTNPINAVIVFFAFSEDLQFNKFGLAVTALYNSCRKDDSIGLFRARGILAILLGCREEYASDVVARLRNAVSSVFTKDEFEQAFCRVAYVARIGAFHDGDEIMHNIQNSIAHISESENTVVAVVK